jgi:tRNA C32,U32 (ribose-2'-O)-methylase TrmJ
MSREPSRFVLQFKRPDGTERLVIVFGLEDNVEAFRAGIALEEVIGCDYVMHIEYGKSAQG